VLQTVQGKQPSLSSTGRRIYQTKYDYVAARQLYVEGITLEDGTRTSPTLNQVAEKLGIPPVQLRTRAASERWTDRRAAYEIQITQERQKKRIRELAGKAVNFDATAFDTAVKGIGLIVRRFDEIQEEAVAKEGVLKEAKERLAAGEPVERWEMMSAVYHKEMEGLAGALEKLQSVGMKALGTDINKHEIVGGDVLIEQMSIHAEMRRDDPQRLTELIEAVRDSGLMDRFALGSVATEADTNIQDAEEVEDTA
jgi:hypothetical protein